MISEESSLYVMKRNTAHNLSVSAVYGYFVLFLFFGLGFYNRSCLFCL